MFELDIKYNMQLCVNLFIIVAVVKSGVSFGIVVTYGSKKEIYGQTE
jgi:hypothetical protein